MYSGNRKEGDEYIRTPARNCVYKELFVERRDNKTYIIDKRSGKQSPIKDLRNLKVCEVPIAEEEPDQSITVLPSITEEDAVNMIMPEEFYTDDGREDNTQMAEMVAEIYEKIKKEMNEDNEKRERELKDENKKVKKELKDEKEKRENELKSDNEKMKELLYKTIGSSDEDDVCPPTKKRKLWCWDGHNKTL